MIGSSSQHIATTQNGKTSSAQNGCSVVVVVVVVAGSMVVVVVVGCGEAVGACVRHFCGQPLLTL